MRVIPLADETAKACSVFSVRWTAIVSPLQVENVHDWHRIVCGNLKHIKTQSSRLALQHLKMSKNHTNLNRLDWFILLTLGLT